MLLSFPFSIYVFFKISLEIFEMIKTQLTLSIYLVFEHIKSVRQFSLFFFIFFSFLFFTSHSFSILFCAFMICYELDWMKYELIIFFFKFSFRAISFSLSFLFSYNIYFMIKVWNMFLKWYPMPMQIYIYVHFILYIYTETYAFFERKKSNFFRVNPANIYYNDIMVRFLFLSLFLSNFDFKLEILIFNFSIFLIFHLNISFIFCMISTKS